MIMKYINFFYTKDYDYMIKNISSYYQIFLALTSTRALLLLAAVLFLLNTDMLTFITAEDLSLADKQLLFINITISTLILIIIIGIPFIYRKKISKLKQYILCNHIFTSILFTNEFKNEDEYIKVCRDIICCIFEPLSSSCYDEHKEYETIKSNILHEIGINLSAFFNVKYDYKFSFSYSDGKTYLYRNSKIYLIKW